MRKRMEAGFTLIEAMAVLAIVAIITCVALPGLTAAVERSRMATTLHRLGTDMALARNSAIMKRTQVVVCPRAGDGCAAGGDWSDGWLVFVDADGNRRPDAGDEILRMAGPPGARLRLSSSRPLLRYQADGRSAASNLTVQVCAGDTPGGRIIVNNLGRIRSERPAAGASCSGN